MKLYDVILSAIKEEVKLDATIIVDTQHMEIASRVENDIVNAVFGGLVIQCPICGGYKKHSLTCKLNAVFIHKQVSSGE